MVQFHRALCSRRLKCPCSSGFDGDGAHSARPEHATPRGTASFEKDRAISLVSWEPLHSAPGPVQGVLSGICDPVSQTEPEGWARLSQTFNISLATVTWFSLQITNPHLPAQCQERPFHPSTVLCAPERCGCGKGPTAHPECSALLKNGERKKKWGLGAAGQGRETAPGIVRHLERG